MDRILFFIPYFCGHYLEYTKHLLNNAPADTNTYIFVLGNGFHGFLENVPRPNVQVSYLSIEDTNYNCNHGYYTQGFYQSLFLRKTIKKYSINKVFLMSFDALYPLLPFTLKPTVAYSGIYYYLYLYDWWELPFPRKVYHSVLMWIMAKHPATKNLYICNDSSAACLFNKKFNTNKFLRIDDPFNSLQVPITFDFRKKYNITSEKTIYIHFGVLSDRKGTWDIVDTIESASRKDINNSIFVFAGKTDDLLFDKLNKLSKLLPNNVLFFPGFCSNDFLLSMCRAANCILMPYKENSQSSGMLGYASQLGIPVIARKSKLIAKLVKKYKLGYLIENNNSLIDLIKSFSTRDISVPKTYIERNSPEGFAHIIFSTL